MDDFKFIEEKVIEPTVLPIPQFGTNAFYDFSDGAEISDDRIQIWVEEAVEYLISQEPGNCCTLGSGNTKVIVVKYEDEYSITVTKNYQEASIFI